MLWGKQLMDIIGTLVFFESRLVIPECARSCKVLDAKPESHAGLCGSCWLDVLWESPVALCLNSF